MQSSRQFPQNRARSQNRWHSTSGYDRRLAVRTRNRKFRGREKGIELSRLGPRDRGLETNQARDQRGWSRAWITRVIPGGKASPEGLEGSSYQVYSAPKEKPLKVTESK